MTAQAIGALASSIVKGLAAALTAEVLRQKLSYNAETGDFHWREPGRGVPSTETPAGRVNGNGYREIGINGRLYAAQRLAWLYVTGEWPVGEVDHVNRERSDNAWSNLRDVNKAQNQANTGLKSSNRSGFRGVSPVKKYPGRWQAQIRENGKRRHLGTFDSPEEANAAYQAAFITVHGNLGSNP